MTLPVLINFGQNTISSFNIIIFFQPTILCYYAQYCLFGIRSISTPGFAQSLTYHFHVTFASLALWMVKSDKFLFVNIYKYLWICNSYPSWVSESLNVLLLFILFQTKKQQPITDIQRSYTSSLRRHWGQKQAGSVDSLRELSRGWCHFTVEDRYQKR